MTQIIRRQQQKQKLRYGTSIIYYSIVRSRRIKTSEIIVDAKDVIVRAPYNKPLEDVKKIVRAKAKWIGAKQTEYNSITPEIVRPSFQGGSTLPYLGRNYPFRISSQKEYNNGKRMIEVRNNEFLLFSENSKLSREQVRCLYEEWILEKAQSIFEQKTKRYCTELGFKPTQIKIKSLRNRWGSVTKRGVINLNANLIKAPENVINYIILHELCHLKVKEHSHHFWALVRRFMPNYQEQIEWLRINGNKLV